jgi:hypothetical protein
MFMKTAATAIAILGLAAVSAADDIAVTVYNSNLGVVSETRDLDFQKGVDRLAFTDVPSQIDATSVRFKVLDPQAEVSILEQNYAFDLVNPEKIYSRYIDKQIELVDKEGNLYSCSLLAYSGGSATLRDASCKIKIVSLGNVAEVNFPALPEGLITKPTLFWLYNSSAAGKLRSRVSYQTTGMNWNAEYVGVLDEEDRMLDLSGWSSISNTSGKTYQDAQLRLIAGDIHRAERAIRPMAKGAGQADFMAMEAPGFEEKAFFEYHMYTLPRKATVADNEIKQISLFEPARTEVEKVYRYRSGSGQKNVEVAIKFQNSKDAGLGMPLPAGRVRLFKADDDGSLILLGEDRIEHTPKDEKLNVKVGTAFDIVGEERLIERSKVSSKVEDQVFEIELRNRKDEPVTVEVEKKLYGFWEITESSLEYRKKDANTLIFEAPLKADEVLVITFTVRFTSR